MRNAFNILIALAFITVFTVSKTNTQKYNAPLCFSKDVAASHDQKESVATGKGNSSDLYYSESGEVDNDDDSFGDKDFEKNNAEGLTLFSPLTVYNSIIFIAFGKSHCSKPYSDPYNSVLQLPIYILNHTLIIPLS